MSARGSGEGGNRQPSAAMRAVVVAAARAFDIEPAVLLGRCRKGRTARARHAAAWVVKQRWPGLSLAQLAKVVGMGDHSSAHHAVRRTNVLRSREPAFREATDALLAGLPVPERVRLTIVPQPKPPIARSAPRKIDAAELSFQRSGDWCDQCDALVGAKRAAACRSRWCSLKVRA